MKDHSHVQAISHTENVRIKCGNVDEVPTVGKHEIECKEET